MLHRPPAPPDVPVAGAVATRATWVLVGAAVLVQIVYPLTPPELRTQVTVLSVGVFAAASLADMVRLHGARGGVALAVVAGGGGMLAEAVGLRTGLPFGEYAYTGTLGPEVLGVPVVVPAAWMMMAWPALVVGRTLARRPAAVALVGGAALAAWDVFLDPQMVAAGHWVWADPVPALPLVPGIPLSNYAGWVLVAALMVAALHRWVGPAAAPSAPAATLYLWTYCSSVLAHAVFFGLPGSAVAGGVIMGAVAVPFASTLLARRSGAGGGPGAPPGAGSYRTPRWAGAHRDREPRLGS